jgi:hypothetical protein
MGPGDAGLIDAPSRSPARVAWGLPMLIVGGAIAVWGGKLTVELDTRTTVVFAGVVLLVEAFAIAVWLEDRRFGSSRLVPAAPEVRAADTFTATLEAAPRLAQAREVRFDLVEMHRSGPPIPRGSRGSWGEHIRATSVVSVSSFQVVPGHTRIPVSFHVPADGWASFKRDNGVGLSGENTFIAGKSETEHAWEVRVSADANGAAYRAKFRITIAPLYEVPPYTPRPIGIPQSDKRRPPEVK